MMGNRMNQVPPVREGEEVDVKIIALGDKGDGIAKKEGFVIVIPGTQVNDEVRIKITKVLNRVAFGEVIGDSEPKEGEEEEEMAEESEEEEEKAPEEDSEDFGEDSEDFGEEE